MNFMLALNIMPSKLKKQIGWKYFYKSLLVLLYVLLIIAIIYSIFFLILKLVLHNHFVRTVQETTVITKSTENYTKQADLLNKEINNIYSIQKNSVYWSYLIQYFAENRVEGVVLSGLSADRNDSKLIISGVADDRDSLLEFKTMLEETVFLKDVDLPFESLLKKNNIEFEIISSLRSYEFKKVQ